MLPSLILVAALLAQADPESRSWNQPVEPFRIAGNIYYVGANEITSFLLATPQGHIVLDAGFVETAPQILANIRKLGFRSEDVKVLLNSQAHYDPAGGFAALKKATGASLQVMEGDAVQIENGHNAAYPNIVEDFRQTFRRLAALPCDIFLGPHGSFFHLEEKRNTRNFVDPQGCRDFIEHTRRDFEKQLAAP